MLVVLAVLVSLGAAWEPADVFVEERIDPEALMAEMREMFHHGFESYRNYAGFERDELMPVSCRGHSRMGGISTTLVDSLDMLAVVSRPQDFTEGVDWVMENLHFDKDTNVSVFETNIRILGGLLAAHMIAANASMNMYQGEYSGGLLELAADLGDRLLVAFDTPTGLPFGTVNLRHGVPKGESRIVCAACSATFSLEFGLLSILTGNVAYEQAAKTAAEVLWSKRSPKTGLLGTHLDIDQAQWRLQPTCGIGGDTDSAYEYFFKAADAFRDERYQEMFNESFKSVEAHLRLDVAELLHYVDSDFNTGIKILNVRSLSAFWPGVLAQVGKLEEANRTIHSFARILNIFGYLPESVCVTKLPHGPAAVSKLGIEPFTPGVLLDGYPLRPELIESIYHLYARTRDESLLRIALRIQQSLRQTRLVCGFCSVHGVLQKQHILLDQMDSFVLSETFKYLYLLWDLASPNPEKNWANAGVLDGHPEYVFTTEAHLFPIHVLREGMAEKIYRLLREPDEL